MIEIEIEINGTKLGSDNSDVSRVARMINGPRSEGRQPCVRVHFDVDGERFCFASAGCPRHGQPCEPVGVVKRLEELWLECGLSRPGFEPDAVTKFVERARSIV